MANLGKGEYRVALKKKKIDEKSKENIKSRFQGLSSYRPFAPGGGKMSDPGNEVRKLRTNITDLCEKESMILMSYFRSVSLT